MIDKEEVHVMLSVYDWKTSNLQKLASIILRKFPQRHMWQCMAPHYDADSDTILVAEGDIDGHSDI